MRPTCRSRSTPTRSTRWAFSKRRFARSRAARSTRITPKAPVADSRIRGETIAAEDVLHDLGAISMMSSDSQAMGRVHEVVTRTWQTAHKMKDQRGTLEGDRGNDNLR